MFQVLRVLAAVIGGFVIDWLIVVFLHIRLVSPVILLPASMIAIWFLLPKFLPAFTPKPAVSKGPPLSLSEEGEWTVIHARPSPMPKRGPIVSVFVGGVIGCVIMAQGAIVIGLLIGAGFAGLLMLMTDHANKSKRHGKEGPFAVKRDAIRLPNGQEIARSRIYRFGVRNTQSGQVLFYGGGHIERLGQKGVAATHQRMLPISNAVVVEHDGTLSYLAGGLTEELSNAVLHEIVNRIDGFQKAVV
jgi:hypothetical protein